MSGRSGFGDLLRGLSRLSDAIGDAVENGDAKVDRSFKVRSLDGSDLGEAFGELKSKLKEKAEEADEAAAPATGLIELELEVFESEREVQVLIDEPRLRPTYIQLDVADDVLVVTATNDEGEYRGEALLPRPLAMPGARVETRNGILTITWSTDG
ncbi:MAG: Hsp20/alpha crystallin family protein [Pseudomonadota bacterium]